MMTRAHCERVAAHETERLLDALPPELAAARDEVLILLEWRPSEPENRGLMGLFEGADRLELTLGNIVAPPRIHLFLEDIRDESDSRPDEFRRQVRVTLLHELGHYWGLDEVALAERGLE